MYNSNEMRSEDTKSLLCEKKILIFDTHSNEISKKKTLKESIRPKH